MHTGGDVEVVPGLVAVALVEGRVQQGLRVPAQIGGDVAAVESAEEQVRGARARFSVPIQEGVGTEGAGGQLGPEDQADGHVLGKAGVHPLDLDVRKGVHLGALDVR